ncbi:MAG: hypothetical protein DMG40_24380 [Acidobacteria bacterium]|nr:MAG: hypothetical protein DMG40_24380 [Acidobacteriota bacterium]
MELNPQYANAHHWYGDYLSIQGRHDEALVEATPRFNYAQESPIERAAPTWTIQRGGTRSDSNPAHLIANDVGNQRGNHESLGYFVGTARG